MGLSSTYSSSIKNTSNSIDAERQYLKEELKQGQSVKNRPILILSDDTTNDHEKHGQWIRRRRLDGSLNRVPKGFYSKVWMTLEKCNGIQIYGYTLSQSLTREMTVQEMKFALLVEEALNRIPEPEYRQLIVECCMLLTLIALQESHINNYEIINIDTIVHEANRLFLDEQKKFGGDATLCCASNPSKKCKGPDRICEHFYDLAPSGRYGSMNYVFKALIQFLKLEENHNQ
jgi:phosphorylase kinase alpha/beta subunit